VHDRQKIARTAAAALLASCVLWASPASARLDNDTPDTPTPSDYGGVGLIEMRNARFMPDGYFSLLGTVKYPDDRVAMTFQALPWLETTFRYTINYALPPIGQRALYDRSFDLKVRLWNEGEDIPQVAVGVQDILGTGVYSGEYLVASKAFGPVDASVGMGWGRLASRAALPNPFGLISSRFDTRPVFSGEGGTPLLSSLFRGKNVGLFGGFEYRTPIPNLTLKLEYSSDAYTRESDRQHANYSRIPANIGVSYRFWSNVDVGVSFIGGKEVAGTFSFSFDPDIPAFPKRIDPPGPFVARADDVVDAARTAQQIQTGTQGDESWRVHFVDLTKTSPLAAKPLEDTNTANAYLIGGVAAPATLKVTDKWVQGRTLVVQIGAKSHKADDNLCNELSPALGQTAGVQDVAVVGLDWNPIQFCGASAQQIASEVKPTLVEADAAASDTTPPPTLEVTQRDIDRMRDAIIAANLVVEGIAAGNGIVEVEISNPHYLRDAEAIARTVRALSATAPGGVTIFRITTVVGSVPVTQVTIPRTQIDGIGDHVATPAELWNATIFEAAPSHPDYPSSPGFPRFTYSIFPDFLPAAFDPDNPLYIGLGVSGSAGVELFRGFSISGEATYSVYNTFGNIKRKSNSLLPHVRSDTSLYLKRGASGIDNLTVSYATKFAPEVFAKFQAGYIESMFAGVGGEVLYRPLTARWALGFDLWDVQQRDYDRLLGVRPYRTVTGNATFYFQTPFHGYEGYVSVGRYLAKDYGATLQLDRRFDSGIRIGAWMTLTNVSAKKFGEGSFDKGILLVFPIEWGLPFSSTAQYTLPLRPIQRDGGQPLNNTRTLYDATYSSSYGALEDQWTDVFH